MIRRPSTPAQTGFRPQLLCALFGAAVAHAVAGATWADTPPAPPLPPPAAVEAIGAQAGLGEGIVVGRGSRLQPAATDGAVIGHLLDGVEVLPEVWSSGWSPGSHVAAVRVAGPDGAPLELPQLPFVYDPDPPTLEWEVGTTALLDTFGLDQDVERRKPPRHTLPERDKSVKVLWSPDGRRWIPTPTAPWPNGWSRQTGRRSSSGCSATACSAPGRQWPPRRARSSASGAPTPCRPFATCACECCRRAAGPPAAAWR
jgi:hypothetical protein